GTEQQRCMLEHICDLVVTDITFTIRQGRAPEVMTHVVEALWTAGKYLRVPFLLTAVWMRPASVAQSICTVELLK
ncbi:MAG TPA: hypothetical protein VGN34_00960, partial [Ktedonobacteraceae bacterium]